ncbi:MAG: VanZ family protein [Terriglobales bacterium]
MCVVIFLLSQDANSGRHSDTVLGWILSLVGANTPHLRHLLDEPFRKFAHVFVYFVLGAFSYRGFALGSRHFSPGAAVRALIFSAAYAATDEIHQSFIPSRGPDVRDVLLDTSAVLLALLIIWLWQRPRAGRPLLTPASSGG